MWTLKGWKWIKNQSRTSGISGNRSEVHHYAHLRCLQEAGTQTTSGSPSEPLGRSLLWPLWIWGNLLSGFPLTAAPTSGYVCSHLSSSIRPRWRGVKNTGSLQKFEWMMGLSLPFRSALTINLSLFIILENCIL